MINNHSLMQNNSNVLCASSRFSGNRPHQDNYPQHNPFKPPIYQSLTSSHGPLGESAHRSNSINVNFTRQSDLAILQMRQKSQKENSSILSNGVGNASRKSCPSSKSSILSAGSVSNGRCSFTSGGDSCKANSSRSSSNNLKADRFIPFRGTQENFFEEFIINNDPFNDNKKKMRKASDDQQ
jgi:hypothetical protein